MSSPEKIREDLEEIKSELKAWARNWDLGSISIILVFQAMKILSELNSFVRQI